MQRFSFDFPGAMFDIGGRRIGLQVITFNNTYGLGSQNLLTVDGDRIRIECRSLVTARGEAVPGCSAWIEGQVSADSVTLVAGAQHIEKIRCLKIVIEDLPPGAVTGRRWEAPAPVPPGGIVQRYPFDIRSAYSLHTPLVFLSDPAGGFTYFRSLDHLVRAKRFAFIPRGDSLAAELIFEEIGPRMDTLTVTPPWIIGRCRDPADVVEQHLAGLEASFGLQPWETRADVPGWAREIALVVAIHGMHWTGYTFNDYADALAVLEWICERIEGRRVLAFLPGWEGRYYWQYGDYRPERALGGRAGFRKLAAGARRLGVSLMPMFGTNCANSGLRGFRSWGRPSVLRSPSGMEFQGNRPDWDTSRAHDPGWQAWLNPGAPAWRDRLLSQVAGLLDEFRLPAVFLDTHHIWDNDPDHPLYDGLKVIRDRLKDQFPGLLLAGEGWYDALGAITPVSQVGSPARWEQAFTRYCRTFGHLMWGDPGRNSSGVHEAGYTSFGLVPDAPHWWPTLTIVDGTLAEAPDKAQQVIEQAHRYAVLYL